MQASEGWWRRRDAAPAGFTSPVHTGSEGASGDATSRERPPARSHRLVQHRRVDRHARKAWRRRQAGGQAGEVQEGGLTPGRLAGQQNPRAVPFRVQGHVMMPKGGRLRYVPNDKAADRYVARSAASARTASTLRRNRNAAHPESRPGAVRRTARRANVKPGIHILRHTFCSHLAMRAAPAGAIQEFAGIRTWAQRSATCA